GRTKRHDETRLVSASSRSTVPESRGSRPRPMQRRTERDAKGGCRDLECLDSNPSVTLANRRKSFILTADSANATGIFTVDNFTDVGVKPEKRHRPMDPDRCCSSLS